MKIYHRISDSKCNAMIDFLEHCFDFEQKNCLLNDDGYFPLNFVHRYVPDMATITYPLNLLTRKGTKFDWNETHQNAFLKIKQILLNEETLGYYDVKNDTFGIAEGTP